MKKITGVFAAMSLFAAGAAAQAQTLHGSGASFPDPIYQVWIAEYHKAHPEVTIDYQAQGSGAGIKAITDKTMDFAGSDAPMSKKELGAAGGDAGIVEVPTVAGAVVLIYNIPGFTGELKLDGPTLAEIYLGEIKSWNDKKIADLNAGAALPALPITAVHRTDGSGTTSVFTNYLGTQSQTFKNKVGAGKAVLWPSGAGGPQSNGVTQLVKQTKGSIGYVEQTYALQNNLPYALMKNHDGIFIKATPETVAAAGEGAVGTLKGNILAVNIWDQPGAKAYPISSFTYIIVYKDLAYVKDAAKAKALASFIRWATTDGEKFAAQLNYAPLSPAVQSKVAAALGSLTWDGKPVP